MTLKTVKGNLITMAKKGHLDIIVHGCNCFHTMGAGIAAEVSKRCPNAKFIDFFTPDGDIKKLGKISYAIEANELSLSSKAKNQPTHFVVVNAYTQFNPGPDFRLSALTKSLHKIKKQFGGMKLRFGFPLIGAGIGGGDWNQIRNEIENQLGEESVTIVEFDGSK